jgi:integrase/recombinase XerD
MGMLSPYLHMFFVGSGARERVVMFATWRDVSFERGVFAITEKNDAELKWTPKDQEQGEIPLPDELVERLRKRRERYPDTRLIFPGPNGEPDGHFLRVIKRLALKAGVNCGECTNRKAKSCKTHPVCERAILHRFRKSFASAHAAAGVDVRTIQSFLRHSSLDTTLGYLAASRIDTPQMREKVNSAFAGLSAAAD